VLCADFFVVFISKVVDSVVIFVAFVLLYPSGVLCSLKSYFDFSLSLYLQPLGFNVDDTKLKRAGLDYWPYPFIGCKVSTIDMELDILIVSANLGSAEC
jgi:hypothetical protein